MELRITRTGNIKVKSWAKHIEGLDPDAPGAWGLFGNLVNFKVTPASHSRMWVLSDSMVSIAGAKAEVDAAPATQTILVFMSDKLAASLNVKGTHQYSWVVNGRSASQDRATIDIEVHGGLLVAAYGEVANQVETFGNAALNTASWPYTPGKSCAVGLRQLNTSTTLALSYRHVIIPDQKPAQGTATDGLIAKAGRQYEELSKVASTLGIDASALADAFMKTPPLDFANLDLDPGVGKKTKSRELSWNYGKSQFEQDDDGHFALGFNGEPIDLYEALADSRYSPVAEVAGLLLLQKGGANGRQPFVLADVALIDLDKYDPDALDKLAVLLDDQKARLAGLAEVMRLSALAVRAEKDRRNNEGSTVDHGKKRRKRRP